MGGGESSEMGSVKKENKNLWYHCQPLVNIKKNYNREMQDIAINHCMVVFALLEENTNTSWEHICVSGLLGKVSNKYFVWKMSITLIIAPQRLTSTRVVDTGKPLGRKCEQDRDKISQMAQTTMSGNTTK